MVDRPYGKNNLFTFKGGGSTGKYSSQQLPALGAVDVDGGYEQYDLGILEIDDNGDLACPDQLKNVIDRIGDARSNCENGAIVVAFIHGWNNNADWDNKNLVSFRRLLQSLMTRELEALQRRVIGVYLGWNGTPSDGIGKWLGRMKGLKLTTFRDRYRTAGDVGGGEAMSNALVGLTLACKTGAPGANTAPLILAGHSMGAYVLQTAFRELMASDKTPPALRPQADEPVSIRHVGGEVLAPDLLLSLNSAAEAEVAREIRDRAVADQWEKRFDGFATDGLVASYNPPILISATSQADDVTKWMWRAGQLTLQKTDGHDSALATHTFAKSKAKADCAAADEKRDFGQPWHCLHKDDDAVPTPRFRIDLPDHNRRDGKKLTHTAYDLVPKDPNVPSPFWLFQVPGDVIDDHSDIFNFKAASLVLGLIQLSGVLASASGTSWMENFSELPLQD